MKTEENLAWWKVILGIFGSIFILVAAQLIAQFASMPTDLLKIPVVGIFCEAIAYVLLAYFGEKLMIEKLFNISVDSIRIKKPNIKAVCVTSAILLPAVVIGIYMMMPGEWSTLNAPGADKIRIVARAILFQSIVAGIVEELVFAGTFVGIMFSVICIYTNNFWNNALVHACWNATTFGIMHIDIAPYDGALYTYVLKTKSMLLSGGDFGMESSVISILAYALVIIVFVMLIKKKGVCKLR